MLDLNGDLSEAIDDMVNEQTGARFVGGLRNVGSAAGAQRKSITLALQNFYGTEADEIFGLLRLFALGKVMKLNSVEALADEFIEEFPVKTINVAYGVGADDDGDKYEIDLPRAEEEIIDKTNKVLNELMDGREPEEFMDLVDTSRGSLGRAIKNLFREYKSSRALEEAFTARFKPSEFIDKKPEYYKLVQFFIEQNPTAVNKEAGDYVKRFIEEALGRVGEVEEYVALRDSPRGRAATSGPTPPRTLEENLQEQELVQTVIDFNELRSKNMNEMFLQQFGAMVELVLDAMFGGTSLPMAIKGSDKDVAAFAKAVGGEKRFIDSARRYGLNHPTTYKNKAKLNNAIKKFEKETGVKWPFR